MNTKKTNECKVITLAIQKGGVAKTTSSIAISTVLAEKGYKVLLIDNDPQHNSTRSLIDESKLQYTITDIMEDIINFRTPERERGIIPTNENFDILPCNDNYAGIEVRMMNTMNREYHLNRYLELQRDVYDYIIIDCPPNLGMLTINAITAADELLIPSQAQDYSATAIQQVLNTAGMCKQCTNPKLQIKGIFLTFFNNRRNEDRFMKESIEHSFSTITLFNTQIPNSVKVAESARRKQSIIKYDQNNPVSIAYKNLVEELING